MFTYWVLDKIQLQEKGLQLKNLFKNHRLRAIPGITQWVLPPPQKHNLVLALSLGWKGSGLGSSFVRATREDTSRDGMRTAETGSPIVPCGDG